MIIPLNAEGTIYALLDEHGKIIGTGDREVCAVLVEMMKRAKEMEPLESVSALSHGNVRSAITF
ncbi:MAG TPA: hypothetical protein VJ372_03760 [Pyrinomonadaceae bacterium]|nr:hypothetical protein [Pyrinomonadaceae bacterium]